MRLAGLAPKIKFSDYSESSVEENLESDSITINGPADITRHVTEGPGGCWLWQGALDQNGYAYVGMKAVHRTSYEMFCGPIPKGLQIDHLCCVRNCVNPLHLEPVTLQENNRRKNERRRAAKAQRQ